MYSGKDTSPGYYYNQGMAAVTIKIGLDIQMFYTPKKQMAYCQDLNVRPGFVFTISPLLLRKAILQYCSELYHQGFLLPEYF